MEGTIWCGGERAEADAECLLDLLTRVRDFMANLDQAPKGTSPKTLPSKLLRKTMVILTPVYVASLGLKVKYSQSAVKEVVLKSQLYMRILKFGNLHTRSWADTPQTLDES